MDISFSIGHRNRLKERFLKSGEQALADYELLEMFLFFIIKRKDTKPIAKSLLKRFKTLEGIMQTDKKLLMEIP